MNENKNYYPFACASGALTKRSIDKLTSHHRENLLEVKLITGNLLLTFVYSYQASDMKGIVCLLDPTKRNFFASVIVHL